MSDQFTPEQRSWIMRQVRSKNTRPELLVRSLTHRMGYRFRIHRKDLPGCPDIVFPKHQKIIFVNGCFWHGHSCKRAQLPVSRQDYWSKKIEKTKDRDRKHLEELRKLGWRILTIWECQLKDIDRLQQQILRFLGPRGTDSESIRKVKAG
jgi:DNA mismatch endonuclease (patch repair protein)